MRKSVELKGEENKVRRGVEEKTGTKKRGAVNINEKGEKANEKKDSQITPL